MTAKSGDDNHIGFIRSIDDKMVEVGVEPPVACSSCELSTSCSLSDEKEKIIQVQSDPHHYSIGEKVQVVFEEKLSTKALLIVYIFPLFLIITVLLVSSLFTNNELLIGLLALCSLLPYFLLFKLFNNSISKVFHFTIEKLDKPIHSVK
jgi:positive regulator of sigma E activity